jgi:hypothetical protein
MHSNTGLLHRHQPKNTQVSRKDITPIKGTPNAIALQNVKAIFFSNGEEEQPAKNGRY